MFFSCVTAGLAFLVGRYHYDVIQKIYQICRKRTSEKKVNVALGDVIVADSIEKCDDAVEQIGRNSRTGVLGFDCEWTNEGPVSLVQLSTADGICVLFRLGEIGSIPPKLAELLSNRSILKVGVASYEDGLKLAKDYGCRVSGTLDLRTLATRLKLPCPKSLASLCVQYLDIKMDKILEVRCSDWNSVTLTEEQINYAAFDARAAVLIYHEVLKLAKRNRTFWEAAISYLKNIWNKDADEKLHGLPRGVIDKKYKLRSDAVSTSSSRSAKSRSPTFACKHLPTRNSPLYHNCYLQAPDGEILCTLDRKKAEWYVSKELGVVVGENPLTVRLEFEPSGRALGEVGRYYTQVKLNRCVVCGASDNFIRKNVVPREYRKYFPLVMKSHQSHDVLLLCPSCHETSSEHDLRLRRKLAETCEAPLGGPKPSVPLKDKYRMAMKVLAGNFAIPVKRRKELEMYIKSVNSDVCRTQEHPIPTQSVSKNEPHGLKVTRYFQERDGGLTELERLWREHFLDNMRPQFLPKLWSVNHNQERLVIRQTQNRIHPDDAKIAGLM